MRYVWTATVSWDDGPEGGEDLGIFTSKRKAVKACREHAELPKGGRGLAWNSEFDSTYLTADLTHTFTRSDEYVASLSYEETTEYHYTVQRRTVR